MSRSRRLVSYVVVWLAAVCLVGVGCRFDRRSDESDAAGGGPDTSTTGPDTGVDSPDGSSDADLGEDARDSGSIPTGIPDRITSKGGAAFRGTLDANERVTVKLEVQANDLVVMRLQQAQGSTWKPGLYLFELQSGSRNRLRWHEPSGDGDAHIPYEDSRISSGFEFYGGGTYDLDLANRAGSRGKLRFELKCIGGPCTDGDGNGSNSGPDNDGVPKSDDNCPSTKNPGQANEDRDIWGDACDPKPSTRSCPGSGIDDLETRLRAAYSDHTTLTYHTARERMFTEVDNAGGTVETLYIGATFQTNHIPDPNQYNTEHTWPQSKMKTEQPPTTSDLNILFPADADANSERSNLPFDEVTGNRTWSSNGSARGDNDRGWLVFEPRDARKGDIARALFYYALVYDRNIGISSESDGRGTGIGDEQTLRKWHDTTDPVSSAERSRNDAVEKAQNNRNPFVDCPSLVDRISDF